MAETALFIFCSWQFADFITGLVHWAEDTYCIKNLHNILGPSICDPNLLHHKDPVHFVLNNDWWSLNKLQIYGSLFVAAFIFLLGAAGALGFSTATFLILTCVFASAGNQVHAWAHRKPTNKYLARAVKLLQDIGALNQPAQHAAHHKLPYDRRYCALGNQMNPLLDFKIWNDANFWRILEYLVYKICGVKEKRTKNNKNI